MMDVAARSMVWTHPRITTVPTSRCACNVGIRSGLIYRKKNAGMNEPIIIRCEQCGVERETFQLHAKYCSRRCKEIAKDIRKEKRRAKARARVISCKQCGKRFFTDKTNVTYCSVECRKPKAKPRASLSLTNYEGDVPKKAASRPDRKGIKLNVKPKDYGRSACLTCGDSYTMRSVQSKYCSVSCRRKWHAIHRINPKTGKIRSQSMNHSRKW